MYSGALGCYICRVCEDVVEAEIFDGRADAGECGRKNNMASEDAR